MKMQFKAAALFASTFLVTSVFGSALPYAEDCSAKDHPCNVYSKYPQCGPEWTKYIDACIASGCIKWIRDPKADCKNDCGAEDHPCNTYHNYKECSPEWEEVLDKCIASQCIVWIRDPKADCPTCDSKLHPCNTYSLYPECSDLWVSDIKKCIPTGCINWFQDPLKVCETKPTEVAKREVACSSPIHPCNTYTSYPQCSEKWVATLKRCIPTGCINWIQDPLKVCETKPTAVAKRAGVACSSPLHPCNTYTSYPQCSEKWVTDLKKCIPTGCINWIQDPLKVCETKPTAVAEKREVACDSKAHPCNTYTSYPQCSEKWVADLKKCIPTGCINWFQDPLAVCEKVEKRAAVVDCTSPKHACNTYNNFEQCSKLWNAVLDQCIASGCLAWIRDPKAVCYGGGDIKA